MFVDIVNCVGVIFLFKYTLLHVSECLPFVCYFKTCKLRHDKIDFDFLKQFDPTTYI